MNDDFVSAALDFIATLDVRNNDQSAMTRAVLTARVVNGVQAIADLALNGFLPEANAIYRMALEANFRLAAICKDNSNLTAYYVEGFLHKRKMLSDLASFIRQFMGDETSEPTSEEVDLLIAENEQRIIKVTAGSKPMKELTGYEWAKRGDQLDFFKSHYVRKSNALHHSVLDLDRNVTTDAGGEISEIIIGPQVMDDNAILIDAISLGLRAISLLSEAEKRSTDGIFMPIRIRLDALYLEAHARRSA